MESNYGEFWCVCVKTNVDFEYRNKNIENFIFKSYILVPFDLRSIPVNLVFNNGY